MITHELLPAKVDEKGAQRTYVTREQGLLTFNKCVNFVSILSQVCFFGIIAFFATAYCG